MLGLAGRPDGRPVVATHRYGLFHFHIGVREKRVSSIISAPAPPFTMSDSVQLSHPRRHERYAIGQTVEKPESGMRLSRAQNEAVGRPPVARVRNSRCVMVETSVNGHSPASGSPWGLRRTPIPRLSHQKPRSARSTNDRLRGGGVGGEDAQPHTGTEITTGPFPDGGQARSGMYGRRPETMVDAVCTWCRCPPSRGRSAAQGCSSRSTASHVSRSGCAPSALLQLAPRKKLPPPRSHRNLYAEVGPPRRSAERRRHTSGPRPQMSPPNISAKEFEQ